MSTTVSQQTVPFSIVDMLLEEQQQLTAVEVFAQQHAGASKPLAEPQYSRLMPATPPGPGQQFAFEVNLDDCSGCKACVAACHNLNGLEPDEAWRKVGLLHGGSDSSPLMQHITTACHHCVEPACAHGCPVNAYEKDPLTGIVRHLDDQCIGCQYCIFKCPYDVPVYSHEKGIVRKCDMCTGRLAEGEAPACVQACPAEAIRIKIVDQSDVLADAAADRFLPAAPSPGYTVPTTAYHTSRNLPADLSAADAHVLRPQHAHGALVWMLVLTQLSAGAFACEQLIHLFTGQPPSTLRLLTALALGMAGLGGAILHLGRPMYAFRAMLGLRRSWLSREILAFNIFAGCISAAAGAAAMPWLGVTVPAFVVECMLSAATVTGVVAVFCSMMIYADTRRPYWSLPQTLAKFLLTGAILGCGLLLLFVVFAGDRTATARWLCVGIMVATVAKLLVECSIFRALSDAGFTPLKRTALLLIGPLRTSFSLRLLTGAAGGLVLPAVLLASVGGDIGSTMAVAVGVLATVAFCLMFVGELLERMLFFAAVVAPAMPGGAGS